MRFNIYHILGASGLLLAAVVTDARAQVDLPFGPTNYEHDFQLFAPVEIDLDNEPYTDDHGYFLEYNKLIWSYSGERVTVGDPDVTVLAEKIYIQTPTSNGAPPAPYTIVNGLQDVYPDAGFAFGNRYEVGYKYCGNGWTVGVLDGPELNQNQVFGFGEAPPIDPDYSNNTGLGGAANRGPQAGLNLRAFGFGSVHVNFATPPGYLLGFRDYLNFLAGAAAGTQVGPIVYAGNYGATAEPGLNQQQQQITVFRVTDDINENGIPGAVVISVVGPDGVSRQTTLTDFGDLHEFNIAFETLSVHNRTITNGIEAMWTHDLSNRHYEAKHQNNHIELSYGARFLKLYDEFDVNGVGGVLDASFWNTSFNNQIVGPQVGAKWTNQRQRWRLSADTRFMFGYNVENWYQTGGIGDGLIPGATNRPLFAQPTYFHRGLQKQDFSPVGDLRVESAYYLTQSIALKMGYTGMFVGNIRRAAPSVLYRLPDLGYREVGTQDLLVNGFDFGAEIVY